MLTSIRVLVMTKLYALVAMMALLATAAGCFLAFEQIKFDWMLTNPETFPPLKASSIL